MVFFPNETMQIYTLVEDGYDDYGRKLSYELREEVPVDMQPYNVNSSLQEFGKILQDTYTLIFDLDIEINPTDKIMINDTRYEIIGSIEIWNHGLVPHKEMTVQRYRKGDEINGGG